MRDVVLVKGDDDNYVLDEMLIGIRTTNYANKRHQVHSRCHDTGNNGEA
jgi:hypothetical protein